MDVPIASVITLGVALVSAGVVVGKLMVVASQVRELQRSAKDQGGRIGDLEKALAVSEERARHTTHADLPAVRGGGRVRKPIHDKGSEGDDDE